MMSFVSDRTVESHRHALGFSRLAPWMRVVFLASAGTIFGLIASWMAFNAW